MDGLEVFNHRKTTEELYAEREKRVLDTIALKKPDRVPVWAFFGAFSAQYAGITHKEEQYDLEKHSESDWKSCVDFEPTWQAGPSSLVRRQRLSTIRS